MAGNIVGKIVRDTVGRLFLIIACIVDQDDFVVVVGVLQGWDATRPPRLDHRHREIRGSKERRPAYRATMHNRTVEKRNEDKCKGDRNEAEGRRNEHEVHGELRQALTRKCMARRLIGCADEKTRDG